MLKTSNNKENINIIANNDKNNKILVLKRNNSAHPID